MNVLINFAELLCIETIIAKEFNLILVYFLSGPFFVV